MTSEQLVRWHDLECGSYDQDMALWLELAAAADGPVLDVGAGTGRVTLALLEAGVDVTAADLEPDLLAELRRRAAERGLPVPPTIAADARAMSAAGRFALVIVPMQTVQLLGGPDGRMAFLARARGLLAPGGVVAAALADALEGYDGALVEPPLPDMAEHDGWVWSSRPIAVRDVGDGMQIHRIREVVAPGGDITTTEDRITLDHLTAETLRDECAAAGLTPLPDEHVLQTWEYVGSTVVRARA